MTGASRDQVPAFWEQSEDRTAMCALGMRVVFARMGALWTHSVFLPPDDDLERNDPARIVSPVYQEIHRHESPRDEALCLLLTGTLFKHHFSAVVSLTTDPDRPDGLMLDVDVADRCRAPVENLAATYTVRLDSGALADAGPRAILWDKSGPGAGRLELDAVAPSTLALAEAGRTATRVQILAAIQPGSYTHRLHYRWRWTSNS
jgi:hypothetical protein